MTNACPECGTPVSERAAVCPQCGFPLRRDFIPVTGAGGPPTGYGPTGGFPGGPPPKKSNSAAILVAVIGGGFAVIVVIGILAAIAIPRFTGVAMRAKLQEGTRMLRDGYTAEQRYYADHGEYTIDVRDLKGSGWTDPASPNYTLRIANAGKNRLCVEVDPKPGATQVYAMSMDETGKQYYIAACGLRDDSAADADSTADDATDAYSERRVLYADRDTTGRRLMTEVYEGIAAYRAEHGRDPTQVAQVTSHVHETAATRNYALHVSVGRNGFCLVAQPREYPDDVHSWAVDAKGLLFDGAVCMGEAVDSLDRRPVADR